MKVLVLHGPNLNLLGTRERDIYGDSSLADIDEAIAAAAGPLGFEVTSQQTQREGEIIEMLHAADGAYAGVLLNPAAYSHTSRAIADAISSIEVPVIEVHLSNIHAREEWRRTSVTAEAARGVIAGFGAGSYIAALHALKEIVD